MKITNSVKYVGVNDHAIDLFEGQYVVPNGMAYNSYVILDKKTAVIDTVDARFSHEWLDNIDRELSGKAPDYLIVQHMEPDHSANIDKFMKNYPTTKIVSSKKAFVMMKNFFGTDYADRAIEVGEGSVLSLGKHTLTFVTAPMVHWPEVIVTYDSFDKILFSADGFGKCPALFPGQSQCAGRPTAPGQERQPFIGRFRRLVPKSRGRLQKSDAGWLCGIFRLGLAAEEARPILD